MSNSNNLGWPYNVLGLSEYPSDEKTIRRAYARQLKKIDQVNEVEKFQELREAYEFCLYDVTEEREDAGRVFGQAYFERETSNGQSSHREPFTPPIPPGTPGTTEFDDPAPVETYEINTDWELVHQLCDEVDNRFGMESDLDRLQRLIAASVFVNPDAMRQLEARIFAYISERLIINKKGKPTYKNTGITPPLMELLDEKFSWLSDYIGLQQKFGDVEAFTMAATELIGKKSPFEELQEKRTFKKFNENRNMFRYNMTLAAISLCLSIAAAYYYKTITPDAGEELFAIALFGMVPIFFALQIAMLAAYFIDWNKVTDFLFSFKIWMLWVVIFVPVFMVSAVTKSEIWIAISGLLMLFPAAVIIGLIGTYLYLLVVVAQLLYIASGYVFRKIMTWAMNR